MLNISLIMLGAGSSVRFGLPVKKQWLRIGDEPLWLVATRNLSAFYGFKNIIIVGNECEYMRKFEPNFIYVKGGETRQESLKNALNFVDTEYVMVSDIARPCVPKELFDKILSGINNASCVVPALKVSDTAYLGENQIQREHLKLIQTPQLSQTSMLKSALQTDEIFTDDSSAIARVGGKIWYVLGDERAKKLTYKDDLKSLNLQKPSLVNFTGSGFDVHKFAKDRDLWLCGEKIDYEFGLLGHSDADAPLHALTDAILGASGLGDIGELYPDNDEKFKDISSIILLKDSYAKVQSVGFELVNADITIMAQKPKISKFKAKMEQNIAQALGVSHSRINVKATTTENLGFVGRCEGIAAMASVNLCYYDWTKI